MSSRRTSTAEADRYDAEIRCVDLDGGRPRARCILPSGHAGDHFYDREEVGRDD